MHQAGQLANMLRALACLLLLVFVIADSETTLDLHIPDTKASKSGEVYICTALRMPTKPMKLVGIHPSAQMEVVHHMLLFGCDEPTELPEDGSSQSSWECMSHGACKGYSESILYGWAKNAPKLKYPDGVGLSVGLGTKIKWIVLQVHYLNGMPEGDHSGVQLALQPEPTPYAAGMISYASGFTIPPGQKSYHVNNECCYNGFEPLTTFAVRVHTHTLGKSVWMQREEDVNPSNTQIVAQRDPQLPQGFIPVNSTRILPGQRLRVTCDFDSSQMTHAVSAGATHDNEMCNMYMMVYSQIPFINTCGDNQFYITPETPGNLPAGGVMVPVPSNMFQPPVPTAAHHKGGVWGDVGSVSTGENGTIWVLFRGGRVWNEQTFDWENNIVDKSRVNSEVVAQLDETTGRVLRSWGSGVFIMTHMITWDPKGFVWVTDVGLHQVLKFTPDGQLLDTIGTTLKPGAGPHKLCKPTQVAPLLDGSVLVADGYCNLRVAWFSPKGKFVKEAEVQDHQPLQIGFDVVHSVVVDECKGLMAVANRERGKVPIINLRKLKTVNIIDLTAFGQVWSLKRGPYGSVLALTWSLGHPAHLLWLDLDTAAITHGWELHGMENLYPHDFDIGPAPMSLTGAGDRLFAVYVAPLCHGCGPLRKFVLAVDDPDSIALKMKEYRIPMEQLAEAPSTTQQQQPADTQATPDAQQPAPTPTEPHAQPEDTQEEQQDDKPALVTVNFKVTGDSPDNSTAAKASPPTVTESTDSTPVNVTRELIDGDLEDYEEAEEEDEEYIDLQEVAPSSPSPSPDLEAATLKVKDRVVVKLPGKAPADGEVITGTDGNVRYVVIPIHDSNKGFFSNGGSMLVMAGVVAIAVAVAAWVVLSRSNRPSYAQIPVDEMLKDFEAHPSQEMSKRT